MWEDLSFKGAITSKTKHAIKHKTSPARLAQLLQPSLAFCFSLQPITAYRPVPCKCFKFYCMFYFTCDRSLRYVVIVMCRGWSCSFTRWLFSCLLQPPGFDPRLTSIAGGKPWVSLCVLFTLTKSVSVGFQSFVFSSTSSHKVTFTQKRTYENLHFTIDW